MKKSIILLMLVISCLTFGVVHAEVVDQDTQDAMAEFDKVFAEIGTVVNDIEGDLCGEDKSQYQSHMTQLAQLIVEANTLIEDVDLYYPIDLWYIYNTISNAPYCGTASTVLDGYDTANTSRYSNEEKMGILENSDICMCWNIATGKDEPTGYWKDGACRCSYGKNNFNPNIGRTDVDWVDTTYDK